MSPLSVVLAHNRYQQAGGEDEVFAEEGRLLETRGHRVERVTVDNKDIGDAPPFSLAAKTVWNSAMYGRIREACRRAGAQVVHFHNTFPIISPAGYYAARAEGAAVVQTLHNYRLVCPTSSCFRDGQVCEDCVTKAVKWPAVVHRCYRGSRAASAVAAVMLSVHRGAGTWNRAVDTYVALSEFARSKYISGGLPADRLVVKRNFLVADPGVGDHRGTHALFIGRLAPEKGIATMLEAWDLVGDRVPLKIVGGGAEARLARGTAGQVEWLGVQSRERVVELMRDAAFLIFPSGWYENCPMTLIQAFATGLPVVASGHGSIAEMVQDGVTGRLFRPGDPADLARAVNWMVDHPRERAALGEAGRRTFESTYNADRNYEELCDVYCGAMARLEVSA